MSVAVRRVGSYVPLGKSVQSSERVPRPAESYTSTGRFNKFSSCVCWEATLVVLVVLVESTGDNAAGVTSVLANSAGILSKLGKTEGRNAEVPSEFPRSGKGTIGKEPNCGTPC